LQTIRSLAANHAKQPKIPSDTLYLQVVRHPNALIWSLEAQTAATGSCGHTHTSTCTCL